MIRVTRHNEAPFEYTAELITFLESLPEDVTFVNIDGEVMVRLPDEPDRDTKAERGGRACLARAGRRARSLGECHAE